MRVVWTAQAQARLTEIYDYIAKDQPLNASRFIDRVTRHGDCLGDHPYAGRIVRNTDKRICARLSKGPIGLFIASSPTAWTS
jgi:plasmid stabilization system protein ParE